MSYKQKYFGGLICVQPSADKVKKEKWLLLQNNKQIKDKDNNTYRQFITKYWI